MSGTDIANSADTTTDTTDPAQPGQPGGSSLLDDQLCFALYAASRAVTSRYRPLLDELGLTYPQYLVLLVLWEHSAVSVKDLGAALQLDYGTLTPLVKRLESNGLVRRRLPPRRRAVRRDHPHRRRPRPARPRPGRPLRHRRRHGPHPRGVRPDHVPPAPASTANVTAHRQGL